MSSFWHVSDDLMLDIEWNWDDICYRRGHYILSNLLSVLVFVWLAGYSVVVVVLGFFCLFF